MGRRLVALFASAVVAVGCAEAITGTEAASGSSHIACGRDDRGPATDPRPGAPAAPLVPQGAQSLMICNYNGMNATPGTPQFGLLGVLQTSDAMTIAKLTKEFDAIRPTPAGAVYNCPMDDDSYAILYFDYGSASVRVTLDTKGCNTISSGPIRRLGLDAPVAAQVQRLVKPVKLTWATVSGHVRLCGGPITMSGKTRCWTSGDGDVTAVEAINSSHHWAAESTLRKGRFHFRVASPGRYVFKLMGNRSADFTGLSGASATLKAGHTTQIVLTLPVP